MYQPLSRTYKQAATSLNHNVTITIETRNYLFILC